LEISGPHKSIGIDWGLAPTEFRHLEFWDYESKKAAIIQNMIHFANLSRVRPPVKTQAVMNIPEMVTHNVVVSAETKFSTDGVTWMSGLLTKDLQNIAVVADGAQNEQFAAAVNFRFTTPIRFTALLFSRGRLLFVGVPSIGSIPVAIAAFELHMLTRTSMLFKVVNPVVPNIHGTIYTGYEVDLVGLKAALGPAVYHKSSVNLLFYTSPSQKMTVSVATTGSVVVVGGPSEEESKKGLLVSDKGHREFAKNFVNSIIPFIKPDRPSKKCVSAPILHPPSSHKSKRKTKAGDAPSVSASSKSKRRKKKKDV
jgi:TATA-box binding protein (TBP) (component of TFIID and TFIIIB)